MVEQFDSLFAAGRNWPGGAGATVGWTTEQAVGRFSRGSGLQQHENFPVTAIEAGHSEFIWPGEVAIGLRFVPD